MKKKNVDDLNAVIKWSSVMDEIDTNEISDGKNTFKELYEQKVALLSVVFNSYPNLSWKTKIEDECFNIIMNTPSGLASFEIDEKYWEFFNISIKDEYVEENENNIDNLLSLVNIFNYKKNKVRERK